MRADGGSYRRTMASSPKTIPLDPELVSRFSETRGRRRDLSLVLARWARDQGLPYSVTLLDRVLKAAGNRTPTSSELRDWEPRFPIGKMTAVEGGYLLPDDNKLREVLGVRRFESLFGDPLNPSPQLQELDDHVATHQPVDDWSAFLPIDELAKRFAEVTGMRPTGGAPGPSLGGSHDALAFVVVAAARLGHTQVTHVEIHGIVAQVFPLLGFHVEDGGSYDLAAELLMGLLQQRMLACRDAYLYIATPRAFDRLEEALEGFAVVRAKPAPPSLPGLGE